MKSPRSHETAHANGAPAQADAQVRLATTHDAATIADFNRAMALETEDKELPEPTISAGVRALMRRPEYGFYLIAEVQSRTAGCLLITYEWSDWRNGLFWWIQSVYVHPDFRRRGIYRRLYAEAKRRAADSAEVRGLRLYVDKDNLAAQRTYARLGMRDARYAMFEELI